MLSNEVRSNEGSLKNTKKNDALKFISMSDDYIKNSLHSREIAINEYLNYYKSTDATPIEEVLGVRRRK